VPPLFGCLAGGQFGVDLGEDVSGVVQFVEGWLKDGSDLAVVVEEEVLEEGLVEVAAGVAYGCRSPLSGSRDRPYRWCPVG
jgi:hypothetical protein